MTAQGNGGRGSQGGRASVEHGKATNSMRPINQRGIAIGPILAVVAILAVLASAIAAGSGSFNSDTSAVKAKAQASAILEYANEVKLGVDRVLGKGCTNTQISFENPIVSGYVNPNAPSDKSCHVFDVNGGGIIIKTPPMEALDEHVLELSMPPQVGRFGSYIFMTACGAHLGEGGGPIGGYDINGWPCYYDNPSRPGLDLFLFLPWLKKDVCLEINKHVEIRALSNQGNGFISLWGNNYKFTGSYDGSGGRGMVRVTGGYDTGAIQGCINGATAFPDDSNYGGYYYFRALIIR